jgi:hypothetical protein
MRLPSVVLGGVLLAIGLAGCGGSGAVARVGDRSISRADVDRLLHSAREEAQNEGRGFPAENTDAYRALQREALAILVSRAQLEVAAKRLGVSVSAHEIDRALGRRAPRHKESIEMLYEQTRSSLGFPEPDAGEEGEVLADATQAQLTLQKLVERLGRDEVLPWLTKARRSVAVTYADGWPPAQ